MEQTKERVFQASSLVALVAVWELLARALDVSALPPPTQVVVVLYDLLADGTAFGPLASTLRRTALGFLLGFGAGVLYGIVVYVYPRFGDVSRGLFDIAMFTPTLVIIFLGLIMLGSNDYTVVILVGFVISTNVGTYMRDALRDFDQDLVGMAVSYKAALPQRVRAMYVPYLIPPMLAAGRIGFSLAWKVAFLCEVFGFPEGLGWELRASYQIYDMPTLLAWLSLFIITLLVVEQLTRFAERSVVRW
jgi:NitT/TauT family transport system permease protein